MMSMNDPITINVEALRIDIGGFLKKELIQREREREREVDEKR